MQWRNGLLGQPRQPAANPANPATGYVLQLAAQEHSAKKHRVRSSGFRELLNPILLRSAARASTATDNLSPYSFDDGHCDTIETRTQVSF
jgi:hypothetical protein